MRWKEVGKAERDKRKRGEKERESKLDMKGWRGSRERGKRRKGKAEKGEIGERG